MSFKAVGEAKENLRIATTYKRLDNQENTLNNITNTLNIITNPQPFPRKNQIKVDRKSYKKTQFGTSNIYKSPSHRPNEHSKAMQQSNYCQRNYTQRQEEPQNTMTPSLSKNTRSFVL